MSIWFSLLAGSIAGTIAFWAGVNLIATAIALVLANVVYLIVCHWIGWDVAKETVDTPDDKQ